jgi:hypothetical protein
MRSFLLAIALGLGALCPMARSDEGVALARKWEVVAITIDGHEAPKELLGKLKVRIEKEQVVFEGWVDLVPTFRDIKEGPDKGRKIPIGRELAFKKDKETLKLGEPDKKGERGIFRGELALAWHDGLFAVKGKEARICLNEEPTFWFPNGTAFGVTIGPSRPTTFTGKAGSKCLLIILNQLEK